MPISLEVTRCEQPRFDLKGRIEVVMFYDFKSGTHEISRTKSYTGDLHKKSPIVCESNGFESQEEPGALFIVTRESAMWSSST